MVTRWTSRPIGSVPFVVNSEQTLEIPRDKPIRRMILRFIINLTNGGTPPTFIEDDILKLIKKIRLVENGSDNKVNLPARTMFFVEQFEKGTRPFKIDPETGAGVTADAIVTLQMDFASDRLNENDLSALLQSRRLSSLDLEIDWGDAADIASANAPTINAGVSECEVEIREVSGTIRRENRDISVFDLDTIDIIEQTEILPIDANHDSFDSDTLPKDVKPAPANILTNMFIVLDDGVRSNARVTDFKTQRESPDTVRILERTFNSLFEATKTEYAQEALPTGVLYVDWVDKLAGGLINAGNEGDIKFRFLTAGITVNEDTIDIFTRSVQIPRQNI